MRESKSGSKNVVVNENEGHYRHPSSNHETGKGYFEHMTQSAIIILAGGSGERFGNAIPKQLTMLAGKTILEHMLVNVASCSDLKQIIVVSRNSIMERVTDIADRVAPGRINVIEGGANRLASTQAGLNIVKGPPETKVLVHDGVRPFLKHQVIRNCLSALDDYEVIDVVIPSSDTLVQVSTDSPNEAAKIPSRAQFRRGQTPQGFWLGKFREVVSLHTKQDGNQFTDDCGMYLSVKPKTKIGLVEGHETNIKITHPMDLFIAEQLILSGQTSEELSLKNVDLSGLNVVILGASSGLGANAKQRLEEIGVKALPASRQNACDISRAGEVTNFLSKTAFEVGPIDAVINFAGILQIGPLAEASQNTIEQIVNTNYLGSLNVARESYPFLKQSNGSLTLVSSSSYYRGRANYAAYSSSKAAVVNLTQALAEEWASKGIRVNCVVPRRADTPMRWAAFPGEDRSTLLQPSEVSNVIIKLLKSSDTGLVSHVY